MMAKCDEGYLCEVCGQDVENITQSDLYLRYVIGELDPEHLHTTKERHILCNPILAQFIMADDFPAIALDDIFAKANLDPEYVQEREALVTRGWRRLQELSNVSEMAIQDYPLVDVRNRLMREANPGWSDD